MELDTDDYLTLRRGIKAATFGNCLIVEPHRQGYTQDFRFKIDQALRGRGLQKIHLIEWYHGVVGHRVDGSLLLDTGRIKSPQQTKRIKEIEIPPIYPFILSNEQSGNAVDAGNRTQN